VQSIKLLVSETHSSNAQCTSPNCYLINIEYIFKLKFIYLFAPVFSLGSKAQIEIFFNSQFDKV